VWKTDDVLKTTAVSNSSRNTCATAKSDPRDVKCRLNKQTRESPNETTLVNCTYRK